MRDEMIFVIHVVYIDLTTILQEQYVPAVLNSHMGGIIAMLIGVSIYTLIPCDILLPDIVASHRDHEAF